MSETLIMTSVGGLIFALLSGQPLVIIGVTGPILVFEESVFKVCSYFFLFSSCILNYQQHYVLKLDSGFFFQWKGQIMSLHFL